MTVLEYLQKNKIQLADFTGKGDNLRQYTSSSPIFKDNYIDRTIYQYFPDEEKVVIMNAGEIVREAAGLSTVEKLQEFLNDN